MRRGMTAKSYEPENRIKVCDLIKILRLRETQRIVVVNKSNSMTVRSGYWAHRYEFRTDDSYVLEMDVTSLSFSSTVVEIYAEKGRGRK